jgi:hypothetical protein
MDEKRTKHPMMVICDVYDLRWRVAGVSLAGAAVLAGVSVRSIRRWEKAGACPVWFRALLLAQAGDLGSLPTGEGWQGWRVLRGALVSPDGDIFTPGQLRGLRWVYGEMIDLRHATRPGSQIALPLTPSETRPASTGPRSQRHGN